MCQKLPQISGGFVWALTDKTLIYRDETGEPHWGYGGDFNENVVDSTPDMCLDGILTPDLEPHPGALELKIQQSPIEIRQKPGRPEEITLVNGFCWKNMEEYQLLWRVERTEVPYRADVWRTWKRNRVRKQNFGFRWKRKPWIRLPIIH